jgi:integrase
MAEKRERGAGRIFRRKNSNNWWMAYYLRGIEYRESAETSDEKQALKNLKHRLKEVGADQLGIKKFVPPKHLRVTVNEMLNNLESDYKLRGIDTPQFRSHVSHIRNHFGFMRALEVTAAQVDSYIETRLAEGARPASINRSTQVFGQAFKVAVERGQLSSAPKIRHLSECGNARQGFFAEREFHAVMENLPTYLQDFALFGFLVGWRKGEIASLKWADVDGDCIRLRPENSKNGEGRVIVLEGELAELIDRRKAQREVQTETGTETVQVPTIFHLDGGPIGDIRKAWQTACCMAGVGKLVCPKCAGMVVTAGNCKKRKCVKCERSWKRVELKYAGRLFHNLRRTSVRNMIRVGVTEKVAMDVSGHRTHSMLNRYNIVSESDLRSAMRRTQEYLRDAAGQEDKVAVLPTRLQ